METNPIFDTIATALTTILAVFAATLVLSSSVFAKTVEIPIDFKTIEEAVSAAEAGDVVLVLPGTYILPLDSSIVLEKNLILRSKNGPEQTTIKGRGANPVITVYRESTATIDGFTITRTGDDYPLKGGGVLCMQASSPSIVNNIIIANKASFGGGVYCSQDSSPLIKGNIISYNNAVVTGGGIMIHQASPTISGNRFEKNKAGATGGAIISLLGSPKMLNNVFFQNNASNGGAVFCKKSECLIENNTIVKNTAFQGGGIFVDQGSAKIINSILWENDDDLFLDATDAAASRPEYNTIKDRDFWGINGNIDSDPLFVDLEAGNFGIAPESPCVDAGSPEAGISDKNGSRNDIGASGGAGNRFLSSPKSNKN